MALVGLCVPASSRTEPVASDPFTIERQDADRFAKLLKASGDRPTAAQLQSGYLDSGGRGIAVFTPDRIENAANLARAVDADPARYRYAIDTCLPALDSLNAGLRRIYGAYAKLLPRRRLPTVHVVFGANNSGGTAALDAQVLGLEVLCGPGTTVEQFRNTMRAMFAHETVHSWQGALKPGTAADRDLLLLLALREGVPDYLATLVTGRVPNAERDRWARGRERALWAEFESDRKSVARHRSGPFAADATGDVAIRRWFNNYGSSPDGRPAEAGYWVGMRIAEAYVTRSPNRTAAIEALIRADDPIAILKASRYGSSFGN